MHADADRMRRRSPDGLLTTWPQLLLINGLLGASYFAAAKVGFLLASSTKQVTAVWPPTGIAVVALLLLGPRAVPGIAVGAFFVNLLSDERWFTAAGIALGNTVGPWIGARSLRHHGAFDWRLARVRDVLSLVVFGAFGSMALTATNGVAWLALGGIVPWSQFLSVWWVWWIGDAMGVLVFAPVLLTWIAQPKLQWRRFRLLEWAALFLTLAFTSRISFWSQLPLMYSVFPFAVWAALRFGSRETATVMLVIALYAVWGLIHGRGPFSAGTEEQQLVSLVLFLGVMTITALVLSAAMAEREEAELALQRARDQLEDRVHARTAELASTNDALKQINLELGRRSRELAAKNEEVESFVYVVSHDLRAPLVNLRGFSEELRASCSELEHKLSVESGVPPPLASDVQRIFHDGIEESLRYVTTSSAKLQRLIDSLLELSRTGREQYDLELVHMQQVVSSTLDVLRGSIAQSGATVRVGDLPDVHGDLTAIGQVFTNLISNAVKYLRPGCPGMIEVGGEEQEESCHFWVRDNGAGLNAVAQRRLFQVFQRFHPELAAGEGMGLAIVKRIVERHGGKVWVESREGYGTTFHLSLPNARGRRTGSWRKIA